MKTIQTLGLVVFATAIILALAESRRVVAPPALPVDMHIVSEQRSGHSEEFSTQPAEPAFDPRRPIRGRTAGDANIPPVAAESAYTSGHSAAVPAASPPALTTAAHRGAAPGRSFLLAAPSADLGTSPGIPSHALYEAPPLPQPAAWADPGDGLTADAERDRAIQQEAERLLAEITAIPTNDPDTHRSNWHDAVSRSDRQLRQRYGGWVWMAHHIQAHHLAHAHRPIPDASR